MNLLSDYSLMIGKQLIAYIVHSSLISIKIQKMNLSCKDKNHTQNFLLNAYGILRISNCDKEFWQPGKVPRWIIHDTVYLDAYFERL